MVTLNAVGDIMLTDRVTERFALDGADYLFRDTHHMLSEADFTIGNLEGPLSDKGTPSLHSKKEFLFRAPPDCARSLKIGGFNIVCLANNHIMDYGPLALYDTIRSLKSQGISYMGAGRNLADASRPLVCEGQGLKIAFLAFTYAYSAKKGRPGCCPCDLDFMQRQIRSIKHTVDLVTVSIHHGIEYVDYPNRYIISLFRGAVDAGASVVMGHHPHVVQGLEIYKNALIAYSLGNFISDYANEEVRKDSYKRTALAYFTNYPPEASDLRTTETFILRCHLNSKGVVDYKLIPVKSGKDFRPLIMDEYEAQVFLKRVKDISDRISQPDDPIWDEMDDLLEKCEILSLKRLGLREVFSKVFYLRPRHFKLAIPFLKAKLSRSSLTNSGRIGS